MQIDFQRFSDFSSVFLYTKFEAKRAEGLRVSKNLMNNSGGAEILMTSGMKKADLIPDQPIEQVFMCSRSKCTPTNG
jgi:hypothetical protein